jgi:hypothetical protein
MFKRRPLNSDQALSSADRLRRLMSEVISLREQVAQAERAANRYGVGPLRTDEKP